MMRSGHHHFADYLPTSTEIPMIATLFRRRPHRSTARRQGRGRSEHDPDRSRRDLRSRGRTLALRAHCANTGAAAKLVELIAGAKAAGQI
jgi:hypothetical protein